MAKDGLVRVLTRGGRHKDLRLLFSSCGISASCGFCSSSLSIYLFIKTAETAVVVIPLGLLKVYLLFFNFRLGALSSRSVKDAVYFLVSGLEIIIVEELLISLLLIQKLLPLKHLLSLFGLFSS